MNKHDIILTLRKFKEANKSKYSIIKLGLFGSANRGDITVQSDVDIVVQLDNQDLFNLIGIKQDLEEQLHLPIDIVSYREKMNTFLKQRIDKEAVYV